MEYPRESTRGFGRLTKYLSLIGIYTYSEEEKQAKIAELKQRLAEKRAAKAMADKEDQKMSEKIRRKAGQDLTEVKARLEEKEMKKLLEAKKREKEQDRLAKLAIKARIDADKAERARKKQEATLGFQQAAATASAQAVAEAAAKAGPPKVYTETRLQIRTTGGQPVVHSKLLTCLFVLSLGAERVCSLLDNCLSFSLFLHLIGLSLIFFVRRSIPSIG